MKRPVTIVGGGLAGLTLGIGLRQRDIPVVIWEAGRYPRHRVCGEFISGRGQEILMGLGLRDRFFNAGTRLAKTAAFFSARTCSKVKGLPESAWCLSRHKMDLLLAEEFRRLGGELRENQRWTEREFGEGVVRANGRRVQAASGGWRWIGLKAHARNVRLQADLEMHFVPAGYVGLCQLADNTVNVCALLRSRTAMPDLAQSWPEWLKGPEESALRARLGAAEFDSDTFCSVAGFSLAPQRAGATTVCGIGDSLTMIPPLTGNGMSMAFESAALAIAPLAAFSAGEVPWNEAQRNIASLCDERFAARLRAASWLQRGFFNAGTRTSLLFVGSRCPWAWSKFFAWTR